MNAKKKCLVVDSSVARDTLVQLFGIFQVTCFVATTQTDAIALFDAERDNIGLVMIATIDGDAVKVAEHIRKAGFSGSRMVVMTYDGRLAEDLRTAGCQVYAPKPIDMNEIGHMATNFCQNG